MGCAILRPKTLTRTPEQRRDFSRGRARTLCALALALTRTRFSNAQQQMCLLLREAMTVGKIALAREFFSNELGASGANTRIKDELSSYCVVTEAPKTTFGKALPRPLRMRPRARN